MANVSVGFARTLRIAAAAALLCPSAAFAADNGIFLGAAVTEISADYDWRLGPLSIGSVNEDTGFKLIGGIRPFDALAIEFDYMDFGVTSVPIFVACPAVVGYPCPDRASIDTRAFSVSALGMLALPLIDIYGRVGVARWESDREVLFISSRSEEGTDPVVGVGAQIRVGSFALRLEYERFDRPRGSVDMTSLAFTYTFL